MYSLKLLIGRSRETVSAEISRSRILENPFLKTVYEEILNFQIGTTVEGLKILEIGSSGGITKAILPNCVTSDIRSGDGVDIIESALHLPFQNNHFDIIIAKDVIHHIPETDRLFAELYRLLKSGGTLGICETYWSLPAQFVYRFLHPEDYSEKKIRLGNFNSNGNQALMRYLLKNNLLNGHLFDFKLIEKYPVNGIAWLLSGGATFTTKVSPNFLIKLHRLEKVIPFWLNLFGFHIIARFAKN